MRGSLQSKICIIYINVFPICIKWFERKKRITFYKKIIRDKQVKQWIVVDSNKERVVEIFKLLYRTKSSVICDMTYSLLFGIKNMINEVRSK